jgi:hypothetical protein
MIFEYRIPGKAVERVVASQSERNADALLLLLSKNNTSQTTTMLSFSLQRLSIAFLFVFVTLFAHNTGATTISKTMPVKK